MTYDVQYLKPFRDAILAALDTLVESGDLVNVMYGEVSRPSNFPIIFMTQIQDSTTPESSTHFKHVWRVGLLLIAKPSTETAAEDTTVLGGKIRDVLENDRTFTGTCDDSWIELFETEERKQPEGFWLHFVGLTLHAVKEW